MKKIIFQFITIALVLILVANACKKVSVSGVNLPLGLFVWVGETATLTPSFVPSDAHNQNVSWESSDVNVATVDNGKVTGIAIGKATITVKTQDGGKTAKCFVTVLQSIEPEMVWVEGGAFTMGCTDEQGKNCYFDENPSHQVTLSSFYIGKYEITNEEWESTMGNIPSYYQESKKPVHNIGKNSAQKYIDKLNAYTGKNYRLPTEAEWEYAARGGNKSKGYIYSGGNFINSVACFAPSNSPDYIGSRSPNELGIYDMSGNVCEWCSDWYGNYSNEPQINPTGPITGTKYIPRGGSWSNQTWFCRVSCRGSWPIDYPCGNCGLRLVLDDK